MDNPTSVFGLCVILSLRSALGSREANYNIMHNLGGRGGEDVGEDVREGEGGICRGRITHFPLL